MKNLFTANPGLGYSREAVDVTALCVKRSRVLIERQRARYELSGTVVASELQEPNPSNFNVGEFAT